MRLLAFIACATMALVTVPWFEVLAQSDGDFQGIIEGHITNGTIDGNDVGSVPLSLLVFRRMSQENEIFAQADSEGRFRFEDLAVHSDMRYFVQAGHKGVAYRSPAIQIIPGTPAFTEVTVFDTTRSDADVFIDRASGVFPTIDESIGLIGVLEVVTFVNQGDRTYVGDLFEDTINGGAVRISLPGNALDINLGHGFGPDGFAAIPGGVINKAPLLPGPSEMIYGYAIPYVGTTASLERRYMYTARNVTVLMPNEIGDFSSQQLNYGGPVDVSDKPHTLFTTSDLPAGHFFELKLENLPVFADLSSDGTGFDTILRFIIVGVMAATAAGAVALGVTRHVTREAQTEPDLGSIVLERTDLVASLASIDLKFETGRLGQEEYERERYALKRRLIEISLLLEEETSKAPGGADE